MLTSLTYFSAKMLYRLVNSRSLNTLYLANSSTVSLRTITGSASTVFFRFGKPRFSASLCQSSLYPSPLNSTFFDSFRMPDIRS